MLGSIGGIAEIAKEAFGNGPTGQAAQNTTKRIVPPVTRG
jgi:hypothetical protein